MSAGVGTERLADARIGPSFIDQALWQAFRAARDGDGFARSWLGLQCRFVEDAQAAVLVLGEPDIGPFKPVAVWPDQAAVTPALSAAAQEALGQRRAVVTGGDDGEPRCIASPVEVDGRLAGVCALALGPAAVPTVAMRQLHWGLGWVETLMRRDRMAEDAARQERMVAAFDLLAAVLEHEGIGAASSALATELARRLDCDPVSVGFLRRRSMRVKALSHSAGFATKMSLVRDIAAAMEEAADQRAVVVWPPTGEEAPAIDRAHADLAAAHRAGGVLTVPLQAEGEVFGAITLERPHDAPFDADTVELVDAVAAVVGPVLAEKRANDRLLVTKIALTTGAHLRRLLGPRHFGRKLATVLAAAVVVFFATATGTLVVTSPAVIEGSVQRSLVSPFAGYVWSEHARAGEVVAEGQLLAVLDDQDLRLERLRLATLREQRLGEYDRALAERARAEANIVRSQIEQTEAQLGLVDEQLARTRILAPFDGVVVRGDLSHQVGSAVDRGQELFQLAPLDSYRVILEVAEGDIGLIEEGQTGRLVLAAAPGTPHDYRIERITPVAEARDGRNMFRVEAALIGPGAALRPSMVGIAKTEVEERLLIAIWTRTLIDWARLTFWRWAP